MLVFDRGPASYSNEPFRRSLPAMIGLVKTPAFEKRLSDLVASTLDCDQITAFAFAEPSGPRVVTLLANGGRLDAVRSAASHYVRTHWREDPSNIFRQDTLLPDRSYAVLMSAEDVANRGYRQHCYTDTGIRYRLSIMRQVGHEYFKISLHRAADAGPFVPDRLHDLFDQADMLCALLAKHGEVSPGANDNPLNEARRFQIILEDRYPMLTARERSVCSLIAIGMSSEAIALSLGISINTVLTFRRRAYGRLNISSQNELLRMLYRTHGPHAASMS
jgi:LuxR family transcriptional regulator, activator of tox operons